MARAHARRDGIWMPMKTEIFVFRPNSKAGTEEEQVGSARMPKRESGLYSRCRSSNEKLVGKNGI